MDDIDIPESERNDHDSWRKSPFSQGFLRRMQQERARALTALKRACASSADPEVRQAVTELKSAERLVRFLGGRHD